MSSTGYTGAVVYIWAAAGDVPVGGDFDGDGVSDLTVYRALSAHWFVLKSSTRFTAWDIYQWGQTGDVPIGGLQVKPTSRGRSGRNGPFGLWNDSPTSGRHSLWNFRHSSATIC